MDYCEPTNVYPLMEEDSVNEYYCTLTLLNNDACIYENCMNTKGIRACVVKGCKYLRTVKKNQSHYVNADYLD
jgi:hypothetical protein